MDPAIQKLVRTLNHFVLKDWGLNSLDLMISTKQKRFVGNNIGLNCIANINWKSKVIIVNFAVFSHQRNFLRCISNVLHYHQCPQEARDKFLEFVEYTLGFRPEQIQMTLAEKKINCLIMSEQHCNDLMVPGWESYGSNFVRGKASDHKKLSFNLLIIFGSIALLY